MARFRKRPLMVSARQAMSYGVVWEGWVPLLVRPTDWVVTDENGLKYRLHDSDFRRVYEPMDDEAHELLAHKKPD